MFDQNDQNQPVQDAAVAAPTGPIADPIADTTNTTPAVGLTPAANPASADVSVTQPEPAVDATATDTSAYNTTAMPTPADPIVDPTPAANPAPVVEPTEPSAPAGGSLLTIKQDALQSLTPLLSQLDQTPEEKFRTTMMMIQASDDQSLVQTAYDAAKEISDEKARAQALLDIVNEINYFTQQQAKTT